MASKTTNEAVARLRDRQAERKVALQRQHAAQERALAAVTAGEAAVAAALRERESVMARLEAAVVVARDEHEAAVAVLVLLSSLEDAAELVGPSVVEVRRMVQRVPKDQVDKKAERLLAGEPVRRGRRRTVLPEQAAAVGSFLAGGTQDQQGSQPGDG
jgi:hypothetical protein